MSIFFESTLHWTVMTASRQYCRESLCRHTHIVVIEHIRQGKCRLVDLSLSTCHKRSVHLLCHLLACQCSNVCSLCLGTLSTYIIPKKYPYSADINIYSNIYRLSFVWIFPYIGKYIVGICIFLQGYSYVSNWSFNSTICYLYSNYLL